MTNLNAANEVAARKAMAWGYALPVVGLTVGILIGTAVNDLFRALEVWTWFAIFALIWAAIVAGAHFAAKSIELAGGHSGAGRGAATLNLILGLIWVYWSAIQSFMYGFAAINGLIKYPETSLGTPVLLTPTADMWINQLIPAQAFILLTVFGVYFFVTLRSKGRKL